MFTDDCKVFHFPLERPHTVMVAYSHRLFNATAPIQLCDTHILSMCSMSGIWDGQTMVETRAINYFGDNTVLDGMPASLQVHSFHKRPVPSSSMAARNPA
jgi:hypothetical protein